MPWMVEIMEEANECLLNELIGKCESTLKYRSQNHAQTFNSSQGVSWDTSWLHNIPTGT